MRKINSKILWAFTLLLISLLFLLQQCTSNLPDKKKTRIVCTTGILADAIYQLVKDSAEVIALMGPGVDPHLFKASYQDLEYLSSADIIVYNGLHLEGKMTDVLKRLSGNKKVIAAGQGLSLSEVHTMGDASATDPHIWFDVLLWKKGIELVGIEIIRASPQNKDYYTLNLKKYLDELSGLDQYVKSRINEISPGQRVLITAHDAFGYFGKAYKMEVRGLQGLSTIADFGLSDISGLVDLIVKRKIKAIFFESSVPKRSIDAVLEGCRLKGHEVKLGGMLYSDALGAKGTMPGTYIGMVKYNVETIVSALK